MIDIVEAMLMHATGVLLSGDPWAISQMVVVHALPWLLSCLTIWMTLLAGDHHPRAWVVGMVNQALWLVWMLVTHTWGLLPLNAALWVVYGRNHLQWREERKA